MKKNYKRILAEDMVARFRKEFYAMFGVFPLVSYSFHGNPLPKITLTMLENLVNDVMESDHPEYYTPQGIRLRSRKRTVVIYRQIFLTIAKEIGYGSTVSAEHIDYDHATAIHAVKMINNLLDSKDDQVL